MSKILIAAITALGLVCGAYAQVRVTGASAKLSDLAGSQTLVTVVLKAGVKDSNLRIASVNGSTVTFVTEKGEQAIYTVDSIEEIQVQGGVVEKSKVVLMKDVLAPSDKLVVERAYARAKEIFDAAANEQNIKIRMAAILALNHSEEAATYLKQLTEGGDLQTAITAAESMFLAGIPISDSLLRTGIDSGNRLIRGATAELCGLVKYTDAESLLVRLAQDRAWEVSAPACRAVARLGNTEIVPQLISSLNERNDDKANAVIWSLLRLGGKDIISQLKLRLPQLHGVEKFRAIYVIYRLGDPEAKRLMLDLISDMPTLSADAAIALGSDGDVSAMDTLRQRLRRREDETEANLVTRAHVAGALIRGGDPSPKGVLQELVRSEMKPVRHAAFAEIVRLNNRTMLSLIQSSVENIDNSTAAEAATTIIALGSSDFRARLLDLRAEEEAALGEGE